MTRARNLSRLSNNNILSVDSTNQRVGVGTSTPNFPLHVVGVGSTVLFVDGGARITGILSVGQGTVTIDGDSSTIRVQNIVVTESIKTQEGGGGIGYATETYVNNALVGYATETYVNNALVGYATQGYVTQQISNLVDGAPGALDTLNELAAALNDDANFATTVTNAIANKVSGVGIQTAGGTVGSGATILDFRGVGVSTVTVASGIATINIIGGGGAGGAIVTSVAPPSPSDGQLWFDTDTGVSYIYYQSQSTWVSQQMFEY